MELKKTGIKEREIKWKGNSEMIYGMKEWEEIRICCDLETKEDLALKNIRVKRN